MARSCGGRGGNINKGISENEGRKIQIRRVIKPSVRWVLIVFCMYAEC